jgi:hypothetical protein
VGQPDSLRRGARRQAPLDCSTGLSGVHRMVWVTVGMAEPPKLLGPHAPVLVSKTSDSYACAPDNLTGSV